jgi:hypothetical protein
MGDQMTADPTSDVAGASENNNMPALTEKGCPVAPIMLFNRLANIFALPDDKELQAFADDIKHRGLLEPITTLNAEILDGRSRYLACRMAGVEATSVEYVGDDPLGFVLAKNVRRRHLTESQRAMVAAKLANLPVGGNQHSEGTPIGAASQLLNVGKRSVQRAKQVLRYADSALVKEVESGRLSVLAAAKKCCARGSKDHASETEPQGEANDGAMAMFAPQVHAQNMTDEPPGARAAAGAIKVEPTDTPSIIAENNCCELDLDAARQRVDEPAITDDLAAATAVTDDDIPAFLDQHPLSSEDQRKLDEVMAAWANSAARAALLTASPFVQEQFIVALRADIACRN